MLICASVRLTGSLVKLLYDLTFVEPMLKTSKYDYLGPINTNQMSGNSILSTYTLSTSI